MKKIIKLELTNGVYWVEVPEAGLFILCGCPADSVKHLMKRGLIMPTEVKGVRCETGPNAILLSDVLLQNGALSNLAEFPVLQMFYRQGLILPNHPNNNGNKPLLIGIQEQVEAQLQYIYRGNYGLISMEEIMATGIPESIALEMMRLKKKFAFGKILHPNELLDSHVVEHKPTEIRNGVSICRLGLNRYEFQYKGESVEVNLNLKKEETYEMPYSLSSHNIRREYFSVIHAGEGDGWDINRPCMASILMYQGKIFLIDAGPNIISSLNALGIGLNEIEGVFHTHCHDDHFAGLTTLIQTDHKIKYFATPLVKASVSKKLSALLSIDEEDFDVYFDVIPLEFNKWNEIEGLEVKPVFSPHPVETSVLLFRASCADGYRQYAHFADIAAFEVLEQMQEEDTSKPGISKDWIEDTKKYYLTPVDVKKIDIGGGLIHGQAKDFLYDDSEKIILSHTALPLTDQEKEIGCGAPFGTVDTLIPSFNDYLYEQAKESITTYFPKLSLNSLRILLNNKIKVFNPESILISNKRESEFVYLILTGNVERILSAEETRAVISSGALIGVDFENCQDLKETYRATSFVNALEIPRNLFLKVLDKNELKEEFQNLHQIRISLQNSPLFGEAISYPIQNHLAAHAKMVHYPEGTSFSRAGDEILRLVCKGKLQRQMDNDVFEVLAHGSFFGEESALFSSPAIFNIKATEPTEIMEIPGELLRVIPVVRLRLLEAFERRTRLLLDQELNSKPVFMWRDEYSVHVHQIDNQHRNLFHMAQLLQNSIERESPVNLISNVLQFLIRYTETHFNEEESLMKQYGYPDFEIHQKKHMRILQKVYEYRDILNNGELDKESFTEFLHEWIVAHTLTEDRKYTAFFNEKGLY